MSVQAFGNTCANILFGPVYLSSESPSQNLEHLADLQKDNRARCAIQKNSVNLAIEGEPHPINNPISVLYKGIIWGGSSLLGIPLAAGGYIAAQSDNLFESKLRFCTTYAGTGRGITAAIGTVFTSLEKAFELGSETLADKARCFKEPELARVGAVFARSLEFFSEYRVPVLAGAAAFGTIAMIYTYRSYVSKQKESREKLYEELFEIYDRAAYELAASYRQAQFENNREEMEFYHSLAIAIQNNMPIIEEDIARCSIALTQDKREQIVGKLENAISFIVEEL